MSSASMSQSLFAWVGTLPPFVKRKTSPNVEDFKDGVILAKILKEVVDPQFFDDLKTSPTEATPLIRLNKRMRDYLSEQVGHSLAGIASPNIPRIMTSGDVVEISRLLQMLLVCCVNSPRREEFIAEIRLMETSVQSQIVEAIQEIMDAKDEPSSLPEDDIIDMQLKKAHNEVTELREERERLSQKCHDLSQKLSEITVEKVAILEENKKLQQQIAGNLTDPESLHLATRMQEENKREVEQLRERNYELEALVDDFRVKNQILQKQISETHFKVASAASAEEEVRRLNDEVDSLRDLAGKASHFEKQMKLFQKKLEEMTDLKQSARLLEEKNTELMKSNFALLDENKKIQNFKSQIDALKNDLAETQQQLSQEKHNVNKATFDFNKTRERLATVQSQVQILQDEKVHLQEVVEDLRITTSEEGMLAHSNYSGDCSIELLPPLVRQKLLRLELENKKLQDSMKAGFSEGTSEGSKILIEELRKREEKLDKDLLDKGQEIADLKSKYDDKVKGLEAIIAAKDEDLKRKDIQYRKCMEKAQSVIKTLEPTSLSGADAAKMEELEKARSVREMEDKLLQSAFYHYGVALHHKAVEARNRTFLRQHRQNIGSKGSELQ